MGTISDFCRVLRFLGQAEYNGVTAEGLFAVRADHAFDAERRLITVLESARAIVFHGSLHPFAGFGLVSILISAKARCDFMGRSSSKRQRLRPVTISFVAVGFPR